MYINYQVRRELYDTLKDHIWRVQKRQKIVNDVIEVLERELKEPEPKKREHPQPPKKLGINMPVTILGEYQGWRAIEPPHLYWGRWDVKLARVGDDGKVEYQRVELSLVEPLEEETTVKPVKFVKLTEKAALEIFGDASYTVVMVTPADIDLYSWTDKKESFGTPIDSI